jgi:putative ABC transport system permease protein
VLVTREFAARHGARPGGVVALNSPNGVRQFQVAAVTGTVMENTVIMVRDVYRALWNDPTVFLVHLVLEEGARPAVVEAALLARLGARHRLQVRSSAALVEYFASQARQAFGSLGVMEAMALLLVLVGIGDTLAASVVERTRELGTMRAIGLRRAGVFRVVALEGAAIGVLGLVAAAGVGLSLGTFWVEMQFPMILGWILDLHCPVGFALRAAGLTVVICLAGSLLPALRAARLRVQEALRAE